MTRVLLTGADGYIGMRMADHLLRAGFDVVGLDTGFHRVGWLYHSADLRPAMITKDTRDVDARGPRGLRRRGPPRRGLQRPRRRAQPGRHLPHQPRRQPCDWPSWPRRPASQRFVHMSSCSVYGASATGRAGRATRPSRSPPTPGARCWSSRTSSALADDAFSPTFLRNATAYGASPRQRFDLVVNDLAATAYLYREIRMSSDGTPWRPFVHILDIATAVDVRARRAARRRPRRDLQRRLGLARTTRSARSPRSSAGSVPGCELALRRLRAPTSATTGPTSPRSRPSCPASRASGTSSAASRELLDVFARIGFDEAAVPVPRPHPHRPDPPPARHRARSTTTSSGRTGA